MDRDRDRDNFATMFDRHGPALYRYAYRRVGADAADDVVEESFVVAWRRRAELPDDPLPWLYRTAANVIANHHRSRARGDRLAARSAAQPPRLGHDPADRVALRRSLAAALGALSDRDREALLLVGWEDLDLDQAAAVAGCSVVAFRGRLRRARNRLRQHLRDAAVLPPGLVQNLPASTEGVAP